MLLIQHETEYTEKYNTKQYNTHVQRGVELSSPDLSITEKVPKQKYADIFPIPLQKNDSKNAQLENTGKI